MMRLMDYQDRTRQAAALAEKVARGLNQALAARGRATLCVPGGTTPGPFFEALAATDLDWSAVTVVLGDERWVPVDHERSNARLLRETLLTGKAAAARFIPFHRPVETPEEGLEEVAALLTAEALPLDILVLGMGTDMHTASIFPGADRLDEALDPEGTTPILPLRAPGAPEPRVTLTLSALLTARETHVLITGEAKRKALGTAMEDGPETEAPIRAILRRAAPAIHYAP